MRSEKDPAMRALVKVVRWILDWVLVLLFLVMLVGIFLGGALTIVMVIPWRVAKVLHFALPVPFWPFPLAFVAGIVALFLLNFFENAYNWLGGEIHPEFGR